MKIYLDKELKQEIQDATLDLGIVLAGDSKEYIYFIYNETEAKVVQLQASIESSEVELLEVPVQLESKEIKQLKIKWNPSITIKKGLKTKLGLKGFELYS